MKKIITLISTLIISSQLFSQQTDDVTYVTDGGSIVVSNDTLNLFGEQSFFIFSSFTKENKQKKMIIHEYSDEKQKNVVVVIYNELIIPTHIKIDKTYYVISDVIYKIK